MLDEREGKVSARERLLDAAEAAVLAKGFAATSIEELVAETGISKSGFFYHFKDKAALAKAIMERYLVRDREIARADVRASRRIERRSAARLSGWAQVFC